VNALDLAGISHPPLRGSFDECERIHREANPVVHHLVTTYLPAQKHPYAHALHAFLTASDRLARGGDLAAFDRWTAASLREVDAGRSDHPVRGALVHTMRTWGLNPALLADFLVTTRQDSLRTTPFRTFEELRVFLRGAAGAPARLLLPILEPVRPSGVAEGLMSLLGEVFQLIGIFHDFPVDLPRGRHYLPTAETENLGEAVIEHQVRRARRMIDEGSAVLELVNPSSRPFLEAVLAGSTVYFDHVARLGTRIMTEGDSLARVPRPRTSAHHPPPIPPERLPRHVAVIMDGNGRWAESRGRDHLAGHAAGEDVAFDLLDGALELGLRHLSLFAFSTENWARPSTEVSGLLEMIALRLPHRVEALHQRGIRLRWAGRRDRVPDRLRTELEWAERVTEDNDRLTLIVCLDYGGRTELTQAAQRLAREAIAGRVDVGSLGEKDFARYLYLPDVPEVDLLIRTSGEQRVSNFLLWQAAYAELVFTDVLWPDADRRDLWRAVATYASRDRRFGTDRLVEMS
jgi:undecaprenyl diphosphate synthase